MTFNDVPPKNLGNIGLPPTPMNGIPKPFRSRLLSTRNQLGNNQEMKAETLLFGNIRSFQLPIGPLATIVDYSRSHHGIGGEYRYKICQSATESRTS